MSAEHPCRQLVAGFSILNDHCNLIDLNHALALNSALWPTDYLLLATHPLWFENVAPFSTADFNGAGYGYTTRLRN